MAATISSTDVHKIQRQILGDMNDIISDLPKGVLLHILSLLPTEDVVRTSVLAKKWRYLWTYLSVFHFEIPYPRYDSNLKIQKNVPNCLLDLVGRLLHKSNCVERLAVQIYRATVDTDRVSSIITSAVKHKVQFLNLTLGHENNKFVLPHSFSAFESLNKLCLGLRFTLHIPSGICFPSLKKLVVSDVMFANEKSVQRLFSGCPVLQELELYDCYWKNIKQISVAISTLRKLRIKFEHFNVCYDHDMKLKIDAVNLLSLSCRCNPTIKFIPVNLTSVVDASIDLGGLFPPYELYAAQCAVELMSGLSNVKSLTLSVNTLQCFYGRKDTLHLLPTFYNLTHLGVISFYGRNNTSEVLMDILQKTPKLEVLEIPGVVHNYLGGEDLMSNSVPCCFKSSLNRLCIFNFYGDEYEIRFLTFMLKNCQYLGEIKIQCSRHLTADTEKLIDVWNQLEDLGLESCVIKLCHHDPSDDEADEVEFAKFWGASGFK